jgi:RimJ/RimL family protein N-acetyltransferase
MDTAHDRRPIDVTIGLPQPYDPDFVRTWMATSAPFSAAGRTLHWSARLADEDRIVGYAALARIDLERSQAELRLWVGCSIDREVTGIEWAQKLLNFAVDTMHIERIYSLQLLRFPLAERILKGIGMGYDGIVRKRVARNAQVEDAVCWSISADEWQTFRLR